MMTNKLKTNDSQHTKAHLQTAQANAKLFRILS